MKEWAIKTTLDSLEGELRVIEFTVSKYKDPVVAQVLKGLEELLGMFDDFVIKTVSLNRISSLGCSVSVLSRLRRNSR